MSDQSKARFKVHPDLAKEFAAKTLQLAGSTDRAGSDKKKKKGDKPITPVQYH